MDKENYGIMTTNFEELSDFYAKSYEWILDTGREGVSIRVSCDETTNKVTLESYLWCCVCVDDTKTNPPSENILEFWWSGKSNSCCVNYYGGKTNNTVDIENYISFEDKI